MLKKELSVMDQVLEVMADKEAVLAATFPQAQENEKWIGRYLNTDRPQFYDATTLPLAPQGVQTLVPIPSGILLPSVTLSTSCPDSRIIRRASVCTSASHILHAG